LRFGIEQAKGERKKDTIAIPAVIWIDRTGLSLDLVWAGGLLFV
jgi:hypothetical protein